MNRDSFDRAITHTHVVLHNISDHSDGNFLELNILDMLLYTFDRIDELILSNEIKDNSLYRTTLDFFCLNLLIHLVNSILVLLNLGHYL